MAAIYGSTPSPAGTIAFGSVNDGSSLTLPSALLVSEGGDATLTVSTAVISGTNAADFTLTGTPVIPFSILDAGAAVPVGIRFEPGAVGARTATLTVTHNATGSPATYTLTGTGTVPAAPVSGVVTNADVDAEANDVPAPYGPLERQTDMSTLPTPNTHYKIDFLDTRGRHVYATWEQLKDDEAMARQVALGEKINYQLHTLIADVHTVDTALQAMKLAAGGPYTQANWDDAIDLLRALRWIKGFI